jgi:hypothetical protein
VDTNVLWNSTLPIIESNYINVDFPKDQVFIKRKSLNYVCNVLEWINPLIKSCILHNKHKHIAVDVKVNYIKEGEYSCIPGWHPDTTLNPFHPTLEEVHHLFVIGQGTEFLQNPTLTIFNKWKDASQINQIVEMRHPSVWKCPSNQWISYGRKHLHRGIRQSVSDWRLLVRVSETDII